MGIPESKEYTIVGERIGKGTFGEVYLCLQKSTKQKVACKRISTAHLSTEERKNINQEATIMKIFLTKSNRHVVKLIDAETAVDGMISIYMEYCSEGDLKQRISKRNESKTPFSEEEILSSVCQIAFGLEFIHKCKVIHRDLKPENILVNEHDHLKITDFGVSAALNRTSSKRNTTAGTLAYMPPEVIMGEEYKNSCDVWSLGVITYELASFKLPFETKNPVALIKNILQGLNVKMIVSCMIDTHKVRVSYIWIP